jgi:phospholipid transport system substrate-binding protein
MGTTGPIQNSDSRLCAFPNVSPATQWPRARKERNGSPRRPGGRGFSLAVGTTLALILISSLSSAETSPRGELQDFFGRVTAILSVATNAKQAREDVRNLARALFDGREAARQALGPDWDRRTGAEREEFIRMFTGVVEQAYLEIVQSRLPRDQPPAIRIVGEDIIAERGAIVRTEVQARYGSDVQLDYLMTRSGKGWLVRDVVIDGVSLVENYRAQFARILRTSSYADLVLRLRTVAGAGTSGPVAAPPRLDVIVAYFDTSRAELSPAARHDLDRAATWLATNGRARVLVEGYSDQRGDVRPNQVLAERRANSIRDYLVTQGVDDDRITTVTYAGQRPICQEPLETCWVQNRRAVVRMTR